MRKLIVGFALAGILIAGLMMPAAASASFFNWGCRYQGTWFGVNDAGPVPLAGWMVTVEGKSFWHGTNNLEFPWFNPGLLDDSGVPMFPDAAQLSSMRGNWMRIGYNRLVYTTTGFAVDEQFMPVYIVKLTGFITLSDDCNSLRLTNNKIQIYSPLQNPFTDDTPLMDYPDISGFRAYIDMP